MRRSANIRIGGSAGNCFVSTSWVPVTTTTSLDNIPVLRLVRVENHAVSYVSVRGRISSPSLSATSEEIKIPAKFAKALNLTDGEPVEAEEIHETFPLSTVHVTCLSPDDWEILESNADLVASSMLSQIRVVYPGLFFPFYVSKSMVINLVVQSISTTNENFGILTNSTDVVVAPYLRPTSNIISSEVRVFRIHPIKFPANLQKYVSTVPLLTNLRIGLIREQAIQNWANESKGPFICEILIPTLEKEKVVKVVCLESNFPEEVLNYFPCTNPPAIYFHDDFLAKSNLRLKTRVWVKMTSKKMSEDEYVNRIETPEIFTTPCVFTKLFRECEDFVLASLNLSSSLHSNVLKLQAGVIIEGKEGSGKTFLCNLLSTSLAKSKYLVHTEMISCSKWRGKKSETVEKDWRGILEKTVMFQPSVIILDDLDVFTPIPAEDNFAEQLSYLRLCETLLECLWELGAEQIAIVATTISSSTLNQFWKSRSGFHFFQKVVSIPVLNLDERIIVFKEHVSQNNPDLLRTVEKEAGLRDLLTNVHEQQITPRLLAKVAKAYALHSYCGQTPDLNTLLNDEIQFMDPSKTALEKRIQFSDIGGMFSSKKELIKLLQWPIKYRQLFQSSPIRLPAGILLYGFPGCGKTLLGLSVPSLVNAKFIHIKGPELLSKYIGASEQAVQDVFKKARNWSPCIIFFDEFDSLVPRRGHDSTGVTDRVVNQFLTQMDGVEGGLGNGVYLIAATSRPDLIDPAVLRPGRLDKHIFIDLPSHEERTEILEKLAKKVNLVASSEELSSVAFLMDGFTGADIQSVVSTAQLKSIQMLWEKAKITESEGKGSSNLSCEEANPEDFPLMISHLQEAIKEVQMSLRDTEMQRYSSIYSFFQSGGAKVLVQSGTRATLA